MDRQALENCLRNDGAIASAAAAARLLIERAHTAAMDAAALVQQEIIIDANRKSGRFAEEVSSSEAEQTRNEVCTVRR